MFDLIAAQWQSADLNRRRQKVVKAEFNSWDFFKRCRGSVLVTGAAADHRIFARQMAWLCTQRRDAPSVILTEHRDLAVYLSRTDTLVFSTEHPSYEPFYGLTREDILQIIAETARHLGYEKIGEIRVCAEGFLNILRCENPMTLVSIYQLLAYSDEQIAAYGESIHASAYDCESILADPVSFSLLRSTVNYLASIFQGLCTGDTHRSLLTPPHETYGSMIICFSPDDVFVANTVLKTEIHALVRQCGRVRVMLDEPIFKGESDPLLDYLIRAQRERRIELFVTSRDALSSMYGNINAFDNVIFSRHATAGRTEEISRQLFGTYQHHYPVRNGGFIHHYRMVQAEEKARISADELYHLGLFQSSFDMAAVSLAAEDSVYLVSLSELASEPGDRRWLIPRF